MPERESAEPEIIHQDEHLLIVHKPPGLPTTAPHAGERSLVRWVSKRFVDLRPHATSRLDSQVSGLVTFALTTKANRTLLDARRAGTYQRVYLGVTIAEVLVESGDWGWPISIDPSNSKLRVAREGRGERAALTRYRVAARSPGATLLRLMPMTGRTHQIRVHAARSGSPLFGDHAYGGKRRAVMPDGTVVTWPVEMRFELAVQDLLHVFLQPERVSNQPLDVSLIDEEASLFFASRGGSHFIQKKWGSWVDALGHDLQAGQIAHHDQVALQALREFLGERT